MLFRPRRATEGPDPLLDLRILLFAIGAVAGILGMALSLSWLVYSAMSVLAVGIIIGLIRRRRAERDD
jgi:hypothetical protein